MSYPDARGRLRVEGRRGTKRQAKQDDHSWRLAEWAQGIMTAAQYAGSSTGNSNLSDPDPLGDINFLASFYIFPSLRS